MIDEKAYNKAVAMNLRRMMYEKGVTQSELANALDNVHLEYEQKAVSAFQIPFQDKYT